MIKFLYLIMSRIIASFKKLILILIFLCWLPLLTFAQLSPGQYLEEAPLGTWNIFGLCSAPSLGTGFSQVVLARSNTIVLTNPALLTSLLPSNLTLNFSFNQTQLFKYLMVNTGVLTTTGNLSYRCWQLNYFGLSQRWRGWVLALVYARNENYGRPAIDYRDLSSDVLYHEITLRQSGEQRMYGLALSRGLNSKLRAGLSLIKIDGFIARNLEETWPLEQIEMKDYRYQKLSGFYPVFGLNYRISDRLSLGLSLIPPYPKKAQGQSLLAYRSPEGNTDIEIRGEADDRIRMPLVIGLGGKYSLRPNLEIFLETVYFGWNKYSFTYFGETMLRSFRSVLRISSGLEYSSKFRLFGKTFDSPYYLGIMIDPQPMTDITSTYYYLTFGSGISSDAFSLTFATAIGLEKGSGHNLKNQKISITLSFYPDLKKIIRGKGNDQK